MTNPLLPPSARSAGRGFVIGSCALFVVALLCAGWLGVRGYLAFGHVQDAKQTAAELRANLTDTAAASAGVEELAASTEKARALTSDPIWRIAEHLPWVGAQLDASATSIEVIDDVASSALTPLVEVAQDFSVEDLQPKDGKIDVDGLAGVQDVATLSAERVGRAADRIEAIDRSELLDPIADQVDEVEEQLRTAAGGADAIRRASVLMPTMLGSDEPRTYLMLVQNNAEWRSLGGLVGSTALLRTENGRIELADQAPTTDFSRFDPPVVDLGRERSKLFDDERPARFLGNSTQATDFPTTAKIAKTMWEKERNETIDGVISVDPVALSYLLEATGPIDLPTGTKITSKNAVRLLLNGVYKRIPDTTAQDLFFQAAAGAVFDEALGGAAEPAPLLDALSRAAGERRILIWSADETEQQVLSGTALQGALPVTDASRTSFGVFLNDGTASKMSYYVRVRSGATWCSTEDGATEATLQVTLRSAAPKNAADLPDSIIGPGRRVPAGHLSTVAYLYLPEDSSVSLAQASGTGEATGFEQGSDRGRPVLTWEAQLAPGEKATATVRVRTPYTQDLEVQTTPSVPGAVKTVAPSCS